MDWSGLVDQDNWSIDGSRIVGKFVETRHQLGCHCRSRIGSDAISDAGN
jgi:hypothetical protein